ncbi:hypothetical protein [Lutibacter sp.]
MKNSFKFYITLLTVFNIFFFSTCSQNLYAQKVKKEKVRLKVKYVKVIGQETYLKITAAARVNKKNIKVPDLDLFIYTKINNKKTEVGKVTTNTKGESKFIFKKNNSIKPDSTDFYNLIISFKGNKNFKKASKSLSFKDANIDAKLITKDSINYITATLIDVSKDSLVSGQPLTVQVQRLFQPLFIDEEFKITNVNGTIIVPIDTDIPGVNGHLTFEVVLDGNEIYGTVKAIIDAQIGIPIVDESTFDERTMWSPRNKTPLFLLIFPNLLIFSIWGLIIYLITNLFKITNS